MDNEKATRFGDVGDAVIVDENFGRYIAGRIHSVTPTGRINVLFVDGGYEYTEQFKPKGDAVGRSQSCIVDPVHFPVIKRRLLSLVAAISERGI